MPSLIPDIEKVALTGALLDHFDTFKRQSIIIYKEPQKIINQIFTDGYVGYGDNSFIENVTYVPVSGIYEGMFLNRNEQPLQTIYEIKSTVNTEGRARIKVREEARDFIDNGKTERIEIDGVSFNLSSDKSVQDYLGLKFYYYYFQQTT
jgi:hypothetical protein